MAKKSKKTITGKEARWLRLRAGLTQQEMADLIGINRSNISRFESGETHSSRTALQYAKLEQKMRERELRDIRKLKKEASTAIDNLINSSLSWMGPEAEKIKQAMDDGLYDVRGKELNELDIIKGELSQFLESSLSTVSGVQTYLSQIHSSSSSYSGGNNVQWDDSIKYRIYRKVLENRSSYPWSSGLTSEEIMDAIEEAMYYFVDNNIPYDEDDIENYLNGDYDIDEDDSDEDNGWDDSYRSW